MPEHCLLLTYRLLRHPGFSFTSFLTQSVSQPWLPTHHCAALVWLTGLTCVTSCHFIGHQVLPTQSFPREPRISLGVAGILSMYLCSDTYLDCNQFLIIRDWYLSTSEPKIFSCGEEFNRKAQTSSFINSEMYFLREQFLINTLGNLLKLINTINNFAPSKNTFQNFVFQKYILKLLPQKIHFKIPSS